MKPFFGGGGILLYSRCCQKINNFKQIYVDWSFHILQNRVQVSVLQSLNIPQGKAERNTKNLTQCFYTCQLFLRCRCEIFILGVLGFLKTTRSFPKIPEEVRSLPKTSEVCRRRSYRENAYPQNQRSRGRYCHLFILHMVFVPYMGLS